MHIDLGSLKALSITVMLVIGGISIVFSLSLWWLRWWLLGNCGRLPQFESMSPVFTAMAWCFLAFGLFLFCAAATVAGFYPLFSTISSIALALIAAGCALTGIVFTIIHIGKLLGLRHL